MKSGFIEGNFKYSEIFSINEVDILKIVPEYITSLTSPFIMLPINYTTDDYVYDNSYKSKVSDEGRTNPSVSDKLGIDCEILWLDVNEIHDDEENKDN